MTHQIAPSSITPSSPLWVAGRALLARRGVDLFTCWSRARQTLDLDAIHDLRVASRRVRECLVLFRPCYYEDDYTQLGGSLRRLTKRLGAIRNTDETLLFMEEIAEELAPPCSQAHAGLLEHLRQDREVEARRLGRFLRKSHRQSLATFFRKFCHTPDLFGHAGIDPFMPVRRYVRNALLVTLAETAPLVVAARCESDSQAHHRWRIAVKKLRYRVEVIAPVVKSPLDKQLLQLKRYQELLGNLHDLDIYRALVESLVTEGEAAAEIVSIILGKRSRAWIEFDTFVAEHPWQHLAAQIEESL